ncbi:hypothetical protein XENOCAPTIV_025508, partial [Xenoophorus captivus]
KETVSVAAGFSEQRSVAPPEGKTLNSLCAGCVGSAEILDVSITGHDAPESIHHSSRFGPSVRFAFLAAKALSDEFSAFSQITFLALWFLICVFQLEQFFSTLVTSP